MRSSLEKNIWVKTDTRQWIKYMSLSEGTEHWFNVVDCIVIDDEKSPYCIFREMKVLVEENTLKDGSYDKYIEAYYDSIEDICDEDGYIDLALLAELIAEIDMFSGKADNYNDIFVFPLNPNEDDLSHQVNSHCDEVEKFIKECL